MTQPTARAVHIDQPLTNISIAFLQNANNFVASQVFPNIRVQKQSDVYFRYDRGFFNRNQAKVRGPATEAAIAGFGLDTDNYSAKVVSLKAQLAWQVMANADTPVQLERANTEMLLHQMLINKEVDWATKYFTTGVWGTEYTGVASSPDTDEVIKWSDSTSGTPIEDIRTAKTDMLENCGYEPNTLVLNQRVMDALVDHPDIIDRIKYSGGVGNQNPARTSTQALSQLFEVDRILVTRAIQNTAAEGDANAHSFIGGNNALLTYVPPTPGLMTPSAGYTFTWSGYQGASNEF
ncbi:MAG TPA: major capsid protein, partial [Marinobacter sp.]|nr:major capsid protein [Marinobacter sp.]